MYVKKTCVRTEGTKRERERVVSLNTCMCFKTNNYAKKNTKNVFKLHDVYLIKHTKPIN